MKLTAFCVLVIISGSSCDSVPSETVSDSTAVRIRKDSIRFNSVNPGLLPESEVTKAYSLAIAEYITATYKSDSIIPDTLFIQRNSEFPEIDLPARIQNINIRVLTPEVAEKYLGPRKSWVLLNVAGWLDHDRTEFIIVTFLRDFRPQHTCHLYFTHRPAVNDFVLDSLNFEYRHAE